MLRRLGVWLVGAVLAASCGGDAEPVLSRGATTTAPSGVTTSIAATPTTGADAGLPEAITPPGG